MASQSVELLFTVVDSGDGFDVLRFESGGHDVVFEISESDDAWGVARKAIAALECEERDALAEKCAGVRDEISRRII